MLLGARHMVAMQISHDPTVRQIVRQAYYERAKITVRPTKKGIKVQHYIHVSIKKGLLSMLFDFCMKNSKVFFDWKFFFLEIK